MSLAPPSPRLRVVEAEPAGDPPPVRPRRVWPVALAVIATSALLVSGFAIAAVRPHRSSARAAAISFLDRYVAPDGRVMRPDQGGDTVSEGQSYAMLLAVAAGDRQRFDRTWHWTQRHLERPDGLLSWHWQDGRVADPMPAADADLDAAWALALAADRFGDAGYRQAASRLGAAMLAGETVTIDGRPLLVAGPWARSSPAIVNPSYLAAPAMEVLARITGDHIWLSVADQGRRALAQLTDDGHRLPSDWARADASGDVWPDAAPNGEATRFGLEAARLVVWQAASCDAADRNAARASAALVARDRSGSAARALDGEAQGDGTSPVALVADAALEQATGHGQQARSLLARAAALDARQPSYYGAAWVALGRTLLTTTALHTCRPGSP